MVAMADTTAITITAVVVAGVVGPAITAMATGRGQKRLFRHERQLRDREDLRAQIDHLAGELNAMARAVSRAHSTFTQVGPASEVLVEPVVEAYRRMHDTNVATARVGLRLDLGTPPLSTARAAAEGFGRVLDTIDLARAIHRLPQDFSAGALTDQLEQGRSDLLRFIDEARAVVGADAAR